MKNMGVKKLQASNKPGSFVKKSKVQKAVFKNKPPQTKTKKLKNAEANVSIKEKLSGKIFSPTVEKAKIVQQQKSVKNSSPILKEKNVQQLNGAKNSSPIVVKGKTVQQKKIVKNSPPIGQIKPSPDKHNNLPAMKKKNKKTKTKIKEEKTVQTKKKPTEHDTKNEKEVISEIKNKSKVIIPEVKKTVDVKQDKTEFKDSAGIKRKMKSAKSDLQTKKVKKEEVKVESRSSPISSDVNTLTEDKKIVTKQRTRKAKVKRKSSVTSIKDLKPISNIKSLVKRPSRKKSEARIQKKLTKFPERGVCYFSRIPHGFYEKELKSYCSQFGEVTGVYHPVSKMGNSRGYAFVEFKHKEVAEVVAETMNNYLMFNRLVKCQFVPPVAQRPWVFKQDRNNLKSAALRRQENLQQQMRNLTKEEVKKWKKRRQERVKSFHEKLEKLGVDYEFQVNDTDQNAAQEEKKEEQ